MTFFARLIMILAILSGCGGGDTGSGGGGIDPRLARLDIYEAQKVRVLGDPGAGVTGMAPSVADIPAQGSATFTGFVTLRIEGAEPLILFGDASLDVDFAAQQISGGMDRFFGTIASGAVADYGGGISITGGQLQRDLRLDYAGSLSATGQQVALNGTMEGTFLGDPISGMTAADLDPLIVQNGMLRTGTFILVMETAGVLAP